MTESPSIAVVMPLFNKGPHVGRAVQSVLDQSSPATELIIVDDGSTDESLAIAQGFRDPRIRIIERTEPGPGGYAARNAGIHAANSEWIAFLDADDTWRPGALAELRRLMVLADPDVHSLFAGYDRVYGDTSTPAPGFGLFCPGTDRRLSFADFLGAWLKVGYCPMWTSATAARRSALVAAGLFPADRCKRGGDKDTWLRLVAGGDVLCSSTVTASYHRDAVNMVTKRTATNHRPCLISTLEAMIPAGSSEIGPLVKRVINLELSSRARESWRNREGIGRELIDGFHIGLDLPGYALLRAIAAASQVRLRASALQLSGKP